MSTFLISFRIADTGDYAARYNALCAAVEDSNGLHWAETTSFYVKATSEDISTFTARLKRCINPVEDLLLVLDSEVKAGRICGAYSDLDVFELLPFLKKS